MLMDEGTASIEDDDPLKAVALDLSSEANEMDENAINEGTEARSRQVYDTSNLMD